ncbi:Non-catalytic module family DOC2 [Piromyces sp. E2]|nr:Non-catalytic module family DOC2 [Piromyces sp. E2]|eukprot:OUM66602.1 Non-catalytic module family DOC2 [Piromyces sp. E2]
MKYLLISIALLLACSKAEDTRYCWSKEYGYECCPDNADVSDTYEDDDGNTWGIVDGVQCGIREGRCWSMAGGYKCCPDKTKRYSYDQDGEWGLLSDGSVCGIRHSQRKWYDRELVKETKEEWNDFKVKWEEEKIDFQRISVFPGDNETELNFAWYSKTNDTLPVICWGKDSIDNCKEYEGIVDMEYKVKDKSSGREVKYYSNKVTVKDIQHDSTYYYKRKLNGEFEQKVIQFNTHNTNNYKFVFVGDPQIGGSTGRYSPVNYYKEKLSDSEGIRNDAFNWIKTISSAFAKTNQEPSLILSAGDQADETDVAKRYNEEMQYSALLLPEQMQQIPMAAALGNHDYAFDTFRRHFHVPNPLENPIYYNSKTGYLSGYNYFFKYNNALVVVLETNHLHCIDFKRVITNGIQKYPNTDWRIAMFHHDIYGNGITHAQSNSDIATIRPCLTKLLHHYKFDVVINGHDHVYTASKFVTYDPNANNNGDYDVNEVSDVNEEPNGTLFITANCSTGSKLYEYYEKEQMTWKYVHKDYQKYASSSFGVLDFYYEDNKVSLNVTTYDSDTHSVIDGPYKIIKKKKCWSEPNYRCCHSESTEVVETDSDGQWGVENGDWCGIVTDEKQKEDNNIDVNIEKFISDKDVYIDYDDSKCWSKKLGYDCCRQKMIDVALTDKDGKWGIEDNKYCGIVEEKEDTNNKKNNKCWSEPLGYPCCNNKDIKTSYTDKDGDWGYENGNWCGIIKVL